MPSQTEGAVTDITTETLAVEEVALSAQSLHYVHPLGAEVADVTAAEVLPHHTLKEEEQDNVCYMLRSRQVIFLSC